MKKKITVASAMMARLGFSRKEAALTWGVREDTVQKWSSGKMDMPLEIEQKLREQVYAWEQTCRQIAALYDELFADEPEIFFSFPDDEVRTKVLLPQSDGFLLNTLASIMANMDSSQGIFVKTPEEVSASDDPMVAQMAYTWLYNLDEDSERLGYFGLFDTLIGAGSAILNTVKSLLESNPQSLVARYDEGTWSIWRRFEDRHDGDWGVTDKDPMELENSTFVLVIPTSQEPGPFDFAYESHSTVQLLDKTGQQLNVGLVLPDRDWGGDTLALNEAVADILNQKFGSVEPFLAWARSLPRIGPVLSVVH